MDASSFHQASALVEGRSSAPAGLDEVRAYVDATRSVIWKRSLTKALRLDLASRAEDDLQLARAWVFAFSPHIAASWPAQDLAVGRLGPCFPPESSAERALDALLELARFAGRQPEPAAWRWRSELLAHMTTWLGEVASYRRSRLPAWKARIAGELPADSPVRGALLAQLALVADPVGEGFELALGELTADLARARQVGPEGDGLHMAWNACLIQALSLWTARRQLADWAGAEADGWTILEATRTPRAGPPLSPDGEGLRAGSVIRIGLAQAQRSRPEAFERLRPELLWVTGERFEARLRPAPGRAGQPRRTLSGPGQGPARSPGRQSPRPMATRWLSDEPSTCG
jgi:hypothetical protein